MNLQQIIRVVMCAALIALGLVSAGLFALRTVAGHENAPAVLHGEAALEQLKQDGHYESLQAAVNQAHFSVSPTVQTPLDRAPNSLFTMQQRLLAADGAAEDYLGWSVALDGNTALIGAPYDDQKRGAAYVFVRNGATWTQQAKLTAQDGTSFDYFGYSVALKGESALIGALYGPGSLHPEQGAAYIFTRSGTNWSFHQKLTANENTHGALFGAAVALDGNTVLVGAPSYTITPSFADIGAVFIFTRSAGTWTQQARLNANDGEDGDSFGAAVALEGDTALVGAPNNAVTAGGQGAAYIFNRSGTAWTQQPRLTANPATVDANFGNAVALSGENVLIGAYRYGSDDRGAAYSFRRFATGWTQTGHFFAPTPATDAQFGVSVALKGDTAVVGASRGLFQPGVDHRSAYVFVYSGNWNLSRQLGPELGSANDGFGYTVALSGDTVLVGGWRSDATATDQGAAYTFVLYDSRHNEQQKLFANDGTESDYFGKSVALSGDTLAIGAWGDGSGTTTNKGAVYLFSRNGTTWTFQQKLTANDGLGGDNFGFSVALENDTLAVGAYGDDIGGNANQGSAYIFKRNGTVWTQQQKLFASGIDGLPNDYFGASVALSGNTVAVGAWGVDNQRGAAYVFTNNGTAWIEQQKLGASDRAPGDNFGYAVTLDGNTLAVGAFRDTIGTNFQQGSAYVFTRNGTVWTQQPKLIASQGGTNDHFGFSVALKGDILLVGAAGGGTGAEAKPGSAYIFARAGTAWNQTQKLTADNTRSDNFYGHSVALSADLLVIGAMGDTVGTNSSQGAAYVYTRVGNWFQQQKLSAGDGASYDYFGGSVALSGNTIAVGAYSDTIGQNVQQGSAYVFVSPACPAISLAPNLLSEGTVGAMYTQSLTASGGSAGEYHFAVTGGALPPGVTVQGDVGLAGIPTAPGTYRFTITATYYLSLCAGSREYVITILPCAAITLNPSSLSHGVVGAAYSRALTATGVAGPYNFAVTAGTLPPGVSLNASGTLSGTPTQAGSYNFAVTANANGCTGMRAYTLAILPTCPALTVNPGTLPSGNLGTPYSQTVTITGGAAPYSFGMNLGSAPPPGLSYINGVLSGTPKQTGMFSFTTRTRDANNCEVTKGYTVTINPPCEPIVINPAMLPIGIVGAPYSQTLTISVSAFAVNFAVTAGALPPGLNLSASGALSGAPTQTGSFPFTVTATANGCTGTRAYSVTVTGNGLRFYPLSRPIRLLDTRDGQQGCDAPAARIAGGTSRTQIAAGRTCSGLTIPASAKALTGNITTVESGGGYLTLFPSDAQQPLAANSNYGANEIQNNVFTVGLGADGAFNIFVTSDTDVVVDVTGYYAPPDATLPGGLYFHPLPKPLRLLETRPGQTGCAVPGAPLIGNTDTPQLARLTCDGVTIPNAALAIVGNATTISPQAAGYLTLFPASDSRPLAASSNYQTGQIVNAPFTVGLSATGEFMIYTSAGTQLVVDVLGYYSAEADDVNGAGLLFNPLPSPVRLLDSRAGFTGCFTPNAPLLPGSTRQQQVRGACNDQTFASGALAIVGNATVINNQAGYLTFSPDGAAQPLVASSNFVSRQILNRHFTVGLGATGMYNIFASSQTDLIVDVSGFFAP